jgi:hypothetical protein
VRRRAGATSSPARSATSTSDRPSEGEGSGSVSRGVARAAPTTWRLPTPRSARSSPTCESAEPRHLQRHRRSPSSGQRAKATGVVAEHPRPATSDTTKGSQDRTGRQPKRESAGQPKRESARRPVGTISAASDDTDQEIETASPEAEARPAQRRSTGNRRSRTMAGRGGAFRSTPHSGLYSYRSTLRRAAARPAGTPGSSWCVAPPHGREAVTVLPRGARPRGSDRVAGALPLTTVLADSPKTQDGPGRLSERHQPVRAAHLSPPRS